MATNTRLMTGLTAEDVFAVLDDGWTYRDWVVGTRAIREVATDWPAAGSVLHYTIGRWPLRKDDKTTSLEHVHGQLLVLRANAWPAGTARITLRTEDQPDGVRVEIVEHPDQGLAARLHNPAFDALIKARNVETLRRLEAQARRRVRR